MPRIVALCLTIALTCLAGCAAPPEPPTRAPAAAPVPEPPRLVVMVVVDQLGQWVLDEYLPLLPADSLFRRARTEGASHTIAFPYSNTATAAGHATLVTGVTPAVHGAFANAVHDREVGRRPIVNDRVHAVIGNRESFVSPAVLRVPTVGDRLHEATGGAAVIVGVSMKARAAVLATGASADFAIFYDDDIPAMTTSEWYRPDGALPQWLQAFNREWPVAETFENWTRDPASLCIRDDAPGEGPFNGWDAVFPHDPAESSKHDKAFGYSAASTPYLFAAARAAIEGEGMGRDEIPDLLVLGVSGTDRIGHVWGANSCEYIDNLLRTDRELTALARDLENLGPVTFVISADHGVARLPEQGEGAGGRLSKDRILRTAEAAAAQALGDGEWVAAYESSNLYFTAAGDARRSELTGPVRGALLGLDGIARVYAAADATSLAAGGDPLDRLAAASLPPDMDADLLIVPEPGWFNEVYDVPGGGANHGTPWDYDREVPLLLWGHGVTSASGEKTEDARRTAATLASLLGIPAPQDALQPPLDGVARGADALAAAD